MPEKHDYNQLPHVSPLIGQEVSASMYGIKDEYFRNNSKLIGLLRSVLLDKKFTILKETVEEFSPQGLTACFVLSESHATIHTYPEHKSLHLHIYSCRGRNDARPVYDALESVLKPERCPLLRINEVPLI